MLKLCLLLSLFVAVYGQSRPIVTTTGGQVQGMELSTGLLQPNFFAFKGIPFAEPPVGNLRFRNPVPHRGWSGVLDGAEHRPICPSTGWFGLEIGGEEDCLFLNVYTPSLSGNRAVMVWIHGGSFTGGSGDSWIYGPDFLVNDGVVVVTFNYRLGVLGFLATGDTAAQGNYAMKDMVEALRWVRNNIARFGGNPNAITVFGESAGGVAVHYLMLSQMGLNLFQRAISQSGTALNPWAFQPNPRAQAENLGRKLGISWSSTQNLVDQLRARPFQQLVDAQSGWLDLEVPRGLTSFEWAPNVEPANSLEPRFLTNDPETLMRSGNFLQLPAIIGYTDAESLFMAHEDRIDNTAMGQFATNPYFYVPRSFNLNPLTQQAQVNQVAQTFRSIYFNGQHPHQGIVFNYTQFMTDHHFTFGIDRTVRYHAPRQTQPIYYYKFSMDGSLNMIKRLLLLSAFPGAVHADDIFHLFQVASFPVPILPGNIALTVRRRMVRMWVNFALTGNPTPVTDSLITARWERYTNANQEFMDIGENLIPSRVPHGGRLEPWHNFQNQFAPW
ncbi:CLUMA_CG000594, isoform A [Clunio marinus]|uniref:Carboxylic ester hydrolase n=1 Tax=Clunio marinus TaxID=568069 RepID=A0A1J1HGT0_9DIPT|nr:CLUMA_CG000594, isoform A [Clunio marinus]